MSLYSDSKSENVDLSRKHKEKQAYSRGGGFGGGQTTHLKEINNHDMHIMFQNI